jgi:homocysteine S-methyltransferase
MTAPLLNWNPFQEALRKKKPLLLDGAIGSYLQQKKFKTDETIWSTRLNYENPEEIIKVHQEYIASGADIITTNTFRTNPSALEAVGIFDFPNYVIQAVNLAKQAKDNRKILIAGSNAPAEDCYQPERTLSYDKLKLNHCKHIDLLIDNNVDFILNEAQSHFDEIQIICNHCDNNRIPYIISLYFNESFNLLSGESLESILQYLKNTKVLAISFNCIKHKLFQELIGSIELPSSWGFYFNCGEGNQTDNVIGCGIHPEQYLQIVKDLVIYNPAFVGSCCGSSPSHTKKIREFLDEKHSS